MMRPASARLVAVFSVLLAVVPVADLAASGPGASFHALMTGRVLGSADAVAAAASEGQSTSTTASSGVQVSGLIVDQDGRTFRTAVVSLSRQGAAADAEIPTAQARVFPDGAFFFVAVPDGSYLLRASGRADDSGESVFASRLVTVTSLPVSNIVLTLAPASAASGDARFDSGSTPAPTDLSQILVSARQADGTVMSTARLGADRRFRLEGLAPGHYVIRADEAPAPWRLDAVQRGGQDITDSPFLIEGDQEIAGITLVFTDRSGQVTGTVWGRDGRPASNWLVVAFANDQQLWTSGSRHVVAVRSDEQGRFVIGGLPPGEYLLAASEAVPPAQVHDRGFLGNLRADAVLVSLTEGGSRVQDLRVSPPSSAPPSMPRPPEPPR